MRKPDRLWHALETVSGLELPWIEWQNLLGPDFGCSEEFLRPTDLLARSVSCPSPGGQDCPRRVVEHEPDDIVAVCGSQPALCDSLVLCHNDIIIYELDLVAFRQSLAPDLGVVSESDLLQVEPGVWEMGTYRQDGRPVFLALSVEKELRNSTARLLARTVSPFFLLGPTLRGQDVQTTDLLRARNCASLALRDLVEWEDDKLTVTTSLAERLVPQLEVMPESANRFEAVQGGWTVCFEGGEVSHFPDLKGLRFLAVLLKNPGRDFKSWELANEAGDSSGALNDPAQRSVSAYLFNEEPSVQQGMPRNDARPDPKALRQVQEHLEDIRFRLKEAEENNDPGTIERLQEEEAQLLDYVAQPARRPDPRKHKRDQVYQALTYALKAVEKKTPGLAQHLRVALQKSPSWCYKKKHAVPWHF